MCEQAQQLDGNVAARLAMTSIKSDKPLDQAAFFLTTA
jgi:hypothetical protein